MKHAGPATIEGLEPLLRRLRELPSLAEKKPGVFYHKGRAFLHFHDDPRGVFADLRAASGDDFDRFHLVDQTAWGALVDEARARCG